MSTTNVELVFDGPGVQNGTIDAGLLAQSLAGYSSTFKRANELLNGEASETRVLVQSEFRRGSFIVDLQLVQVVSEHAQQLLSEHPMLDSAGIASALGFVWKHKEVVKDGLLDLFKWLEGKKPDSAVRIGESTELTLGVNRKIVTNNVYNLYGDEAIRQGMAKFAGTLAAEPLERISMLVDGVEQASIDKSEIEYFSPEALAADSGSQLLHGQRDAVLTLAKLAFNEKSNWTFFEQGATVVAKITDADFWNKVHSRTVTFGEGDTLVVSLTWNVEKKTRLVQRNTILKVLRVIPRPQQLSLPPVFRQGRKFRVDLE